MENRRLLLAALLSAVVILGWSYFFPPKPPVRPPLPPVEPAAPEAAREAPPAPPAETAEAPPEPAGVEVPEATEAEGTVAGAPPEAGLPPSLDFGRDRVEAAEESQAVIETDAVRAVFTNRGAQLVSFVLKNQAAAAGGDLELIRARGTDPYPYALVVDGQRSHRLNKALFEWQEETDDTGQPVLRFRHHSELGTAEKVFRWTRRRLLEAQITVAGPGQWGVLLGPGVRNPTPDEAGSRFAGRHAAFRRGKESETFTPKSEEKDVVLPAAGLDWVSLEDNYFLAAALPVAGWRDVILRPVVQRPEVDEGAPRFLPADAELGDDEKPIHAMLMVVEADGDHLEMATYLGAKEYQRLVELGHGLEETVRWGSLLGVLARPLYYGLEWIHGHVVPNYGWAIVVVTFLIKLLFFPLTFKSQKSMAQMQELNPKIQAIRNKYRAKLKDRQGRPNPDASRQMNEEVMKVYREAGVNPVSGCLPMVFQLPVFFAFYRLLSTAVELRNASWIFWIKDLSVPDPWYVLPLVMGATSIALQRMTPSAPDPMQRRLMQMMPIMFTFFAINFASGLVLYWLTNNLLTMAQQAYLLRAKKKDQKDQKDQK